MTYHLPRIEHWVKNKTTNYYICNFKNQLVRPIMFEYLLLHIRLITGGDYLYNIASFFSLIVVLLLSNEILIKLHINKFIRFFIILMIMTMPITIVESHTTQVDLFSSIYFLSFIDIIIDFFNKNEFTLSKTNLFYLFICGCLLAFGFLSKTTIIIASLPFIFIFGIYCINKKIKLKNFILYALIALIPFIILLIPTSTRNLLKYGDIFGKVYKDNVTIGTLNPKFVLINILKNYTLLCNFHIINDFMIKLVSMISSLIGINVNDPLINFNGDYKAMHFSFNCYATSPFLPALILPILLILIMIIIKIKKIKISFNTNFLFSISTLFSIFSLLLAVKYCIYQNRVFLPISILMCILIGLLISTISKYINYKITKIFIYAFSFIFMFIFCFACTIYIKHINYYIGKNRIIGYFDNRKYSYKPYMKIYEIIKNSKYKKIGIWGDGDTFDYPLLKMFGDEYELYNIQKNENDKFFVENNQSIDCIIAINRNKHILKNVKQIDYSHYIYEMKDDNFIQEFY